MLAEAFLTRPWIVGWHWCGWLENPHRGFGLKDPWDEPDDELVGAVAEPNARLTARFAAGARGELWRRPRAGAAPSAQVT